MNQQRIREPFIARLATGLLNVKTLEMRPWVKRLLQSLMELQRGMNRDIRLTKLLSIFTNLKSWLNKLWGMSPKQKEQPSTDGRDAEDKSQHKGDWGSHTKADRAAEALEPTEEQLKQAQAVINSQWIQPE